MVYLNSFQSLTTLDLFQGTVIKLDRPGKIIPPSRTGQNWTIRHLKNIRIRYPLILPWIF